MGGLEGLLDQCKCHEHCRGEFLGLLHIAIGRRVEKPDGSLISKGVTWRQLARLLKKVRWPTESVDELPVTLNQLPPRDRERFWYLVISLAHVDSEEAVASADRLAERLRDQGYVVVPPPEK